MKFNHKKLIPLIQNKTLKQVIKNACGEKIGSGLFRDVYVLKHNPEYVVKIERDMSQAGFVNAMEWRNYIQHRDWTLLAPFVAPCEIINEKGNILIQRRAYAGRRKDYPKYIPAVFTDLKLSNFGWIEGQFVCFDYAYLKISINKTMQYAKWWGTLK